MVSRTSASAVEGSALKAAALLLRIVIAEHPTRVPRGADGMNTIRTCVCILALSVFVLALSVFAFAFLSLVFAFPSVIPGGNLLFAIRS